MNRNNDDRAWKERTKRCREILKELMQAEFKGKIKKVVYLTLEEINGEKPGDATNAEVYFRFLHDDMAAIVVNKYYWSQVDFDEQKLRNTLRHELLHLELKRLDDDPVFRNEAQRRGIGINTPKKNVCWLCSECGLSCKRYADEGIEECSEFFRKNWLI